MTERILSPSEQHLRVQKQAAEQLAAEMEDAVELPLQKLQAFRRKEENRLKLWHRTGGGGREIAARRTELVDILFREIFRFVNRRAGETGMIKGLVAVAFGGYGRRELNPFSDVDITFLHAGSKPTPVMERVISDTLMTLWDLGFKVGHATRSVKGAIAQANADMITKTAMIESRRIEGDRKLFEAFRKEFEASCVHGKEEDYIAFRTGNLKELRGRYGASVFMQEPNIKSGCGGLRDYQNLVWTGAFHSGATTTSRMVEQGLLREKERRTLEEAHDFLLRVRTEMHYQTRRASDQLTLQLQGKVATALGYPEKNILRRCEAFMRDYYSHARETHLVTTLSLGRIREERGMKETLIGKILGRRSEKAGEFLIRGPELFPAARDIFNREPVRMMQAFHLAQARKLDFSAELGDLVKRRLKLVDRTFRYNTEIRNVFLSILSRKGEVGRILRLMHDLGFLGKYLPEFEPLTCLVQHEFFHRYTADEHTLRCIDKIDDLLFTESPKLERYGDIFRRLPDPEVLYLAMLFHDVGKAANTKRHEEASALAAQKVARRLQLTPEQKRRFITLVSAHGEISTLARTRNVDDPATVEELAHIVRDQEILDALMIITLADGMGTSDDAWSDWKEQMVWRLYHETKGFLADSAGFHRERAERRGELQRKVGDLLPSAFTEEVEAHFSGMSDRYFAAHDAATITSHLRLFHRFFREGLDRDGPNLDPVVEWIDRPEAGHAEVLVCGWDRERLLERISAAFLEAGINILGADIHTRADGLALDIFRVSNHRNEPLPKERDRLRFETRLRELLSLPGSRALPMARRPARAVDPQSEEEELRVWVVVNNTAHPDCTILELQAPDKLGLLYHLLRAISHDGISIQSARIATECRAALDAFYLRGRDGGKITDQTRLLRLERRIRAAVRRADPA